MEPEPEFLPGAELQPPLNVLELVPGLAEADVRRINDLVLLARAGKAAQMYRALDTVRVHPAKVQAMLAEATDKHDMGYRVLSAAFAVRDSEMVRSGLNPTVDAKIKLQADEEYQRRSSIAMRALRGEGYKIEAFRYFAVGRLAIVTANIEQPPAARILGPRTPNE